jgi:hypothetical protein
MTGRSEWITSMIDDNLTGSPADAGGEMFAMRKKFVKFQGSFWPSQISMLRSGSNSL